MIKLKIDTKDADSIRTAVVVTIALGVEVGIIDPSLAASLLVGRDEAREALDDQQAGAVSPTVEEKSPEDLTPVVEEKSPEDLTPVVESPEPAQQVKLTLELLRTELAKKVDAHRPALVVKLNELGAENLTLLSEDKYAMMYDFMICLSDG